MGDRSVPLFDEGGNRLERLSAVLARPDLDRRPLVEALHELAPLARAGGPALDLLLNEASESDTLDYAFLVTERGLVGGFSPRSSDDDDESPCRDFGPPTAEGQMVLDEFLAYTNPLYS